MQPNMNRFYMKGKIIKNYKIGELIGKVSDMGLFQGVRDDQFKVSLYVLDLKQVKNQTINVYTQYLIRNKCIAKTQLIDIVSSKNYKYFVFEELHYPAGQVTEKLQLFKDLKKMFMSVLTKLDSSEIFLNKRQELRYLPNYRTSEKVDLGYMLFTQLYNKEKLAQFFWKAVDVRKDMTEDISWLISNFDQKNILQMVAMKVKVSSKVIEEECRYSEDDRDDEQIVNLVAGVTVNPQLLQQAQQLLQQAQQLLQQAQQLYIYNSMRNSKDKKTQTINDFMEQVAKEHQSSLLHGKQIPRDAFKQRKNSVINSISADKNLFKTYFELYYAQFKLFKSFVKEAISIYKQGSGGILLAYFMFLISIIRKSKLVAELKKERNIFETDSDMRGVDIARLISSIKHECISQAKMLLQWKDRLLAAADEVSRKAFSLLKPYSETNLDMINQTKLQKLFFITLADQLEYNHTKGYFQNIIIEIMYLMLNQSYDILYDPKSFPKQWDQKHFNNTCRLIKALQPDWKPNFKKNL